MKKDHHWLYPLPQQVQGESSQDLPKDWKFVINHSQNQFIGNPSSGVRTRSSLRDICNNLVFISQIKLKNINDTLVDEYWMIAIQEELNQFEIFPWRSPSLNHHQNSLFLGENY